MEKLNLLNGETNESEKLLEIVWSQMPNPFSPSRPDSAKITSAINLLDVILNRLDTLKSSGITQIGKEFWQKVITGLKAKCVSLLFDYNSRVSDNAPPSSNKRDALMAGNLIWLAEKKYPGKKIIVWSANFHCCRALGNIEFESKFFNGVMKKTVTMVDSLNKAYGKSVYTISTADYENDFETKVSDSTLEYSLNQTGYKYCFLNLRSQQSPPCLDKEFTARILVSDGKGDWRKVTDGLFFIRGIHKSNINK
jgi:erythromycin esterase